MIGVLVLWEQLSLFFPIISDTVLSRRIISCYTSVNLDRKLSGNFDPCELETQKVKCENIVVILLQEEYNNDFSYCHEAEHLPFTVCADERLLVTGTGAKIITGEICGDQSESILRGLSPLKTASLSHLQLTPRLRNRPENHTHSSYCTV